MTMLSGPVANKIYCPHEYPSSLLDLKIKFECRRIASYNNGQLKRFSNSLRSSASLLSCLTGISKSGMIDELKKSYKIHPDLQGLQNILCRYSSLEKYQVR